MVISHLSKDEETNLIPMTRDQLPITAASMMPSHESLLLSVLDEAEFFTVEQLVERLPEMTWNQLFQILDDLSRRNAIVLRRHGFEYEVTSRSSEAH